MRQIVRHCVRALLPALLGSQCLLTAAHAESQAVVVAGLGGEPTFDERFRQWGETVATGAAGLGIGADRVRSLIGKDATRERIEQTLRDAVQQLRPGDQFMLVLIGHGSFDGTEYRFNIAGPDVTGTQIASWLEKIPAQVPQLIVNATSTSGAVAERWARQNRIVITATRSGGERNATRFARYWAEAVSTDAADRDKDSAVTAQEAFDYALRKVGESFKADAAVLSEHAKLVGAEPGAFIVTRLGPAALFASDAALRAMRVEQAGIEQRLAELKPQKSSIPRAEYFNKLEPVLVELARLNARIDARLAALGGATKQEGDRANP